MNRIESERRNALIKDGLDQLTASATFTLAGEVYLQVGRYAAGRFDTCLLDSESDLDEYMENDSSFHYAGGDKEREPKLRSLASPTARFFLLNPTHGWGRLQINQQAMSKLMRRYGTFPPLVKYLSAFGEKTFPRDEGFGGYDATTHIDEESKAISFESCFLWKYVELGGLEGRYPYTIRQTLVYQQFNNTREESTNIIVRIPNKLAAQMKSALTSIDSDGHRLLLGSWPGLQILCAASGLDEWRNFINYLDHEVSKLFDDLILSGATATAHGKADGLQYRLTSTKRLQFFLDQILRAGQMLDVNVTTMGAMLRAFRRRQEHIANLQSLQDRMEDIRQDYTFLQKMAKSVLDRAVMLSHDLRDTVAIRNHDINKQAHDATAQGTRAIVQLSRKSAYEARVVKFLSLVAVVFLPASFAADFLQMGYVFVSEDRRFEIHANTNLWLYAIFAIPLLSATMVVYVVFELLSRRKARIEDPSGKGADSELV